MPSRFVLLAVAGLISLSTVCPEILAQAPNLTRMRAFHMGGDFGGNQRGIKRATTGLLDSAKSITASTVQITVNRSSFVDSSGTTRTNDTAVVRFTGVRVGPSTTFNQAGFWIGRDTKDGHFFVQFRPSLDSSLAGISGFTKDITFTMSADGSSVVTSDIYTVSGQALDLVTAVVAHAPELIQTGSFVINAPATFDRPSILQALQMFRTNIQSGLEPYFQFLKAENVQWLGISVGIFSENLSDPTVKVKYRPAGDTSLTIYTFADVDLQNFISLAKQHGLSVYLTLAFEPGSITISTADPTCHTPQAKVNRFVFGKPKLDPGDPESACIDAASWWWNPSNANYATNVAQFWSTYTQVAVKYGTLAQQWGVDIYSLGTETDNLFRSRPATGNYTNDFKAQLTQMVTAVRAVYSRTLTYDQHFSTLTNPAGFGGGAGSKNLFSDLGLDVVGVSAYFHLTTSAPTGVLSVAQLETAWESVFQQYLLPLQASNPGKPILFTEFGYTDDVGSPALAATNSGDDEGTRDANGVTDGMRQQQNVFQAFFNVDDRHDNLVRGAFIWGNDIFMDNASFECDTIGFGVYCKPSAQTVKDTYGHWQATSGFAITNLGGVSQTSTGAGNSISVGYGRLQASAGSTTPSGIAIFGFRRNNVLVSEVGVSAVPPISYGRLYAEIAGNLDAGLAIANPNSTPANINFYFTDTAGNAVGFGATTLAANQQTAQFLDQPPFKVYPTPTFQGTFSFTSSVPIAVVALRGFTNENGDFLMSTLPVIDTTVPPNNGTSVVPHFAAGGGWTTQVLLVNPTDSAMAGTLQFTNPSGAAVNVTISGQTNSSFAYSVPKGTSQKLSVSGLASSTASGSVRIVPTGGAGPTPLIVFSYKPAAVTVSEAGVPVTSGSAFRVYVESTSAAAGSIQSGIAVANTSAAAVSVTFEVTDLASSPVPGISPVAVTVPGFGQIAKFLGEIFPSLPAPFKGILRITTGSGGLTAVGLRTRVNERGDFLFTTTPPANENSPVSSMPAYFPMVADGGGYTTQFILFSGAASQTSSGTLQINKQDGSGLDVGLR